ncbi:hypothetical protein [Ferrimicrobium acidiphilum]|uniref:Uncharacterized protein n=1 Tax=Ferrimicrobium acidiphilum DSM 19497 TaxID=1121877 RepID=A0A0D8FS06_9ACTN|nr:hypothetical protein [Ferrimicrobium acidiphilum]KJE75719.1 hypothetical protein FEAC_25610 [Ferrimicrobium acidiphilum DSM 19497]
MTTWLDHHDIALVNRAVQTLRDEQPARWAESLERAGGDPRFALWLTLVDDLVASYPPLATNNPPSLPISQLRSQYCAGSSPISAASSALSDGGAHATTDPFPITPGR